MRRALLLQYHLGMLWNGKWNVLELDPPSTGTAPLTTLASNSRSSILQFKADKTLGRILARVLAEQYEAVAIGGIAARQGSFSPHRHLPWTRGPPKLLNAISVEDGAVASRSVISTT